MLREDKISELLNQEDLGEVAESSDLVEVTERPSIAVDDLEKLVGKLSRWNSDGNFKTTAERSARSVGLIEVENAPQGLSDVGTAFLIGKNRILTAGYVAETFVIANEDGNYSNRVGLDGTPIQAFVRFGLDSSDFSGERVKILRIIHVEQVETNGIAILEILDTDRPPLRLMKDSLMEPNDSIITIGFPFFDARIPPEIQNAVFRDSFGRKSVSPGRVIESSRSDKGIVEHDCSTLGGFGGAPLIDLRSGEVVGIHIGGAYLKGNYARAITGSLKQLIEANVSE